MLLGIDWGKLFSVSFWTETRPGTLSTKFEIFFLIVLVVCYILFFVAKFFIGRLNNQKRFILSRFIQKASSYFLTLAVTFSFIFFFRYEGIPILGGRYWVFLWVLGGIAWLVYLIVYYRNIIPKQLKELEEKQRLLKYLPKKK